eukprot:gnl/MRDRNA2_/MRDRNA2_125476_c0_seq1.p1 gnl/MRDRNA2_/MRDRNA2_125476_c0~~gnl/MRDRNA2_/MRDRNA2_125476_c0_seq1.p1  ORF type:complete len:364 (+),score=51.78 gnl/MRDRNA2_/MRDRNA2_125476_c0_seq1:112-1203(+)
MPPRDHSGGHGEEMVGPDGRRKSLTSRMFGMRTMWNEGSYEMNRGDGVGEDGKVDIVGERCRALADAANRIAGTLRAEPTKSKSPKKEKRTFLRHGEIDRHNIVENFLGTNNDDVATEAWSPGTFGNTTDCEPTPHMEIPTQPCPPDRDPHTPQTLAFTPVQSRFLAGGGGGSAALSPTYTGGYSFEHNPAVALGGAGRLPPADLDQRGQPLGPPSPDNILRELAAQVASLREEVVCDREAQRHEAHVRQVGLLTDASVKVPNRAKSGTPHGKSMNFMMDPVWNEQSLASSRAASTFALEGVDISQRLRTLTDRVGQLYSEVHHGAGKCLCRYMPEGMACSYCLEVKADAYASQMSAGTSPKV